MGGLFPSQAAAAAEVGNYAVIAVHSAGEWTHNWQSHTQNNKMISRWPTNPTSLAFCNRIHKSRLCPPLDHPFDLFASLREDGNRLLRVVVRTVPLRRAGVQGDGRPVQWRRVPRSTLTSSRWCHPPPLAFRAIASWFDLGFRSSRCVGGVEAVEGACYVVVRAREKRAGGGKSRRRDEGRAREEDPGAAQHLKEE